MRGMPALRSNADEVALSWYRSFVPEADVRTSAGDAALSDGRRSPKMLSRRERAAPRNDGVEGPLTASSCQSWIAETNTRDPSKNKSSTEGVDLAKEVFQVH